MKQRARGADYVENLLEQQLAATPLSPADRRLCQELVYGVVRSQAALDWLIARKTSGRTQKTTLQILLRLGLYQLFWLERVPSHAAVHETVEIAKRNGFGSQAGFINAVLRGFVRESDATRELLAGLKRDQPAVGYSHPEWLVSRWLARWDRQSLTRLLEWNNTPPDTCARVNTLKTDAGRLLAQWRDENVEYDFIRRDWFADDLVFQLKAHPPLTALPSFQQGLFYVQDPGTLLAVKVLAPLPGDTILDLCAAPGGKATYLAQIMGNQGVLVAHDLSADRLKLVAENCQRLGVTICRTVLPASAELRAGAFDRVLLDAPCSNTGVMRRRVDLRWRIQPRELDRLRTVQSDLLGRAGSLVKPGGAVVYSTCSLEPEENQQVVQEFLNRNPGFQCVEQRELLPFKDGVDGAFVARLDRMPG